MKVVVLLSRVPYPLEKGDKLRAFHHIRSLSTRHEVVLCCLNDSKLHPEALEKLSKYCSEIHIIKLKKYSIVLNLFKAVFSDLPFQVHYFYQKSAQKQIDAIIDKHLPGHLFVQLVRTAKYASKYTFLHSTFDYMDAFSTGVERRIKYSLPVLKQLFTVEAKRLKLYEAEVFKYFRNKIIISEQDKELIRHPDKSEITVIPNGVDLDFFKPNARVDAEYDLVFVGNMSYPPNVRAATYLAQEILPEIHKTNPEVTLRICGVNPTAKVKSLSTSKITVTGRIPDIRDAYLKAKIFTAPMQIGTGLQNKLLEAMALGIPCVTGELANRALGAKPKEEIIIGLNPADYAAKIIDLLTDAKKRNQLAKAGHNFLIENFSWSKHNKTLLDLIESQRDYSGLKEKNANTH